MSADSRRMRGLLPGDPSSGVPAEGPVAGLVLAAGGGRRMGGPKALLYDTSGVPWVRARAQTLLDAGCSPVFVTVGAEAARVRATLERQMSAVAVPGWQQGMGSSLRAGLRALSMLDEDVEAVVVALVDTPGLTSEAVYALVEASVAAARGRTLHGALSQAVYAGSPGHPVLIGRNHWLGVHEAAEGETGAREYLREHKVRRVEVGDLADGTDFDTRQQLTDSGLR